jgi:phosphoribosylformylglycinamidine (FGAM) synthase PurS component
MFTQGIKNLFEKKLSDIKRTLSTIQGKEVEAVKVGKILKISKPFL